MPQNAWSDKRERQYEHIKDFVRGARRFRRRSRGTRRAHRQQGTPGARRDQGSEGEVARLVARLEPSLASGQTVRHLTLDQGIQGSNPCSPANPRPARAGARSARRTAAQRSRWIRQVPRPVRERGHFVGFELTWPWLGCDEPGISDDFRIECGVCRQIRTGAVVRSVNLPSFPHEVRNLQRRSRGSSAHELPFLRGCRATGQALVQAHRPHVAEGRNRGTPANGQ